MKHDYTDDEIRSACKDVMSLRAFLDALPTRSAQPERPQPWPGQQEAIDAAFCSSNRGSYTALKLSNPFDWEQQAPARLAIAQAYDKARPQAAEIAALKAELDHLEERDRQGREELVRLRAELREARKSEDHWHSEAELLRAEEAKAQAELAALRQPILADDGRSLGQVAFDAGNAIQKIKFPKREIETWEENAEFHDMLEAAAQAVAAEVEARMIKRMEAVPAEELEKAYWDGNEAVACYTALKRVRARLIAAANGEGQAPPVVVNEPPQDDKQPDLSGESEKQAQPTTSHVWTPTVGQTVRLKSGGPVMTVTQVHADSTFCQWFEQSVGLSNQPFPAACLTPAPNP